MRPDACRFLFLSGQANALSFPASCPNPIRMPEIDLHTHSTASDGTLSPSELVAQAVAMHLRAVALTDHDTVQGLPSARAAGRAMALKSLAAAS